MTSVLAPVKTITLQGLAPDVIQSCVLAPAPPTPDPEPADAIYAPVAPGITYAGLPVVPAVVDTSPDQIIGCCNDVGTDPQGRLNALFPAAISGDGVVDRASNDIWVFDGATWNNVGPTPGPTLTVTSTIPPWNEIVVYDARVRAGLEVNGLAYALELLTEPAAYGITLGLGVQTSQAFVEVPAVDIAFAAATAPIVSGGASVIVSQTQANVSTFNPQVFSGASVSVPAAGITLAVVSDIIVGQLATKVFAPPCVITAASLAPSIGTGSSVSVPISTVTLAWASPAVLDAATRSYVQAVQSADGAALEDAVIEAIDTFIRGCKSDGIWSAIKAACILAGARTLDGALVPLVGATPSSVNFAEADYNRVTGLVGNGATKYINSQYAYPTALRNNCHASVFASALGASTALGPAYVDNINQGTQLNYTGARCYSVAFYSATNTTSTGFRGISRSNSTQFTYRAGGANETATANSVAVTHGNLFVHARNKPSGTDGYSNSRISFYSIGESLNLALLDSRVTQLMVDIDAAI